MGRAADARTLDRLDPNQAGAFLDGPRTQAGDLRFATPRFAPQLADDTSRQINDLLVGLGRRTQDVAGLAVVEEPITASITLTGRHATASVWSVLVIAVPGAGAGRQLWRTTTMELELVDGRWLVDAWSSTPGPTPAPAAEGVFDDARALAPVMAWPAAYGEVR